MTLFELKQYQNLKKQKEIFESELGMSYIAAVDTTKPVVQTSNKVSPTESVGLKLADSDFAVEYKIVKARFENLQKWIAHIKDTEVRTIVLLIATEKKSFEEIAEFMNYSEKTVKRKFYNYLRKN